MRINFWVLVLILIVFVALSMYATYMIASSSLPLWLKLWLLR